MCNKNICVWFSLQSCSPFLSALIVKIITRKSTKATYYTRDRKCEIQYASVAYNKERQ